MNNTVDEALLNAESALADFAMMLEEDGRAIPPPSAIEDIPLEEGEMVAYVRLSDSRSYLATPATVQSW